ncbi:MAG TPA: FecR family protein [Candidatus Dormibacteraeota bacterium]|nr:FecR family protein [Candidatus Dormibacteraeota bacterium]
MAIEPPPAPPPAPQVQQQAVPPATTPRSGCFGRGCGCGCGGCLLVVILVVLLTLGGGYWFFVVQASAAVNAPATLIIFNQPVTVDGHPGIAGESLNPGSTVATGAAGHAQVQFPDGSFVRLSPNTTVTVTAVQLQKTGRLQTAQVVQKVGRTFTDVEHLASGASFQVNGHSVSAQVRGTQFEILVRPDGTNRIWAFVGTVTISGRTTVQLHAGQEIDADSGGSLNNLRSSQFDVQDANPLTFECTQDISSGTTAGTTQTWNGDDLATGQTAENDYYSTGGNLTLSLCYPGSLMSITLTTPDGHVMSHQGPPPVIIRVPNGAPGLYKAVVKAISVSSNGEPYSIAFATDAPCASANVDTAGVVRQTLSTNQLSSSLSQAGISLQVVGVSATSSTVTYFGKLNGVPITWTLAITSGTPNLSVVVTSVTVNGINFTPKVVSYLSSVGVSLNSLPTGFTVDRVYSCAGADGDTVMVVEGHR